MITRRYLAVATPLLPVHSVKEPIAPPDPPSIAESGLPGEELPGEYGAPAPNGAPATIASLQ